ncbi:MAG: hypothetical protein A3I24_03795 [Candidatus Harrisonbacteria bacterium RIFCSPLOWO2_02_FULL_41_13b]|uniref:Bacterial type II secretion system protein E domain-containing protein n=1 Tax=Candidatus Harrisonbacteria bacterium RIFCSPLOWO2_02_FULL_41_13b TaxID=1798409 RepID=A0A1G1ZQC0_9BACT|nr:MAG: hypothetical protein A3J53_03400 [Candidatus Harrisonbacteria bacterium RIFCSPHIGHO2_02_FULL_40_20]OGY66649.1 MAG: hypothetical protein A3I24_03795 [Candidatus Harrisonbacteria bacterium RIFCSPLOWO2_02_FULL_41_13b]
MALVKEKKQEKDSEKLTEKKSDKPVAKLAVQGEEKVRAELAKGSKVSIISLVDAMIESAFKSRASDIHMDPEESRVRVRFRIDGVMHETYELPKGIQSEISTRIKVLSGLRTDEHQAAQDGRFRISIKGDGGAFVDIRVSIVPTYYGENVVMRLLAEQAGVFNLEGLGFVGKDLEKVKRAVTKPYGMILATGPTGSGKTTTLYTILKILNTPEVSIVTVEDPVEYAISGIDQIQVNPRTNLTFAKGLRAILRQDPNIIMVGEIRDEETAGIAVNAALTGHLLLSTLHTNDAPTAFPRLIDMKVEPFLIASTVNVVIGQRLVRRICLHCKVEKQPSEGELKSLSEILPPEALKGKMVFYVGKGCKACDESGYLGRVGIHEVMEVEDEIRDGIMHRANADEIRTIAVKNGMTTMIQDGFSKVLEGLTTVEEILRVIHE